MLDAGPAVSGWSDQCWTLARIAEIVRRRFGIEYTLAGFDLLHRIGWSGQIPTREAAERGLEGRAAARHKKRAADLGAVCFENEAGQGLRLPKGRTWGSRGHTPVVKVTAAGTKRVSMAALICTKAGRRPRLIYRIYLDRGPAKDRRKGFSKTDYARLLDAAHQQLGGPIILVWDCENDGVAFAPRSGSVWD